MNCKPGDLALITRHTSGGIVEVLRFKRQCPDCLSTEWWVRYRGGEHGACDAYLTPLRPAAEAQEPAADVLSPKPEKEHT